MNEQITVTKMPGLPPRDYVIMNTRRHEIMDLGIIVIREEFSAELVVCCCGNNLCALLWLNAYTSALKQGAR